MAGHRDFDGHDFTDQSANRYINAKIRYTVGNKIVYFRGHALPLPVKDYDQYHKLAGRVRKDRRYIGRTRSFGMKSIEAICFSLLKAAPPK